MQEKINPFKNNSRNKPFGRASAGEISDGIKLIVGLGNPGKKYQSTFHNAGFDFVDYFSKHGFGTAIKSDKLMNLSGLFVTKETKKRGLKPQSVLIAHDDSDIGLGAYKISFGRGAAGHKGVESIISALKTKDFWRLRIGVRPISPIGPIGLIGKRRKKAGDFVLKPMSQKDKKTLESVFQKATKEIEFVSNRLI